MKVEASLVSETTIQDASVLERCVQRKFTPAPLSGRKLCWQLYNEELKEANGIV